MYGLGESSQVFFTPWVSGFQQHSLCKELGAQWGRGCGGEGSWRRSTRAFLPWYPLGSIWQPGIYIHFVWGDMFYMPVLPVIGQTFTLWFCEALGKQGLGLERTSILAEGL